MKYLILTLVLITTIGSAQTPQGNQLFFSGNYPDAKKAYETQLMETPSDSAALFGLARVALMQEEWDRASELLVEAANNGYPAAEIHYYSSRSALHLSNLSEAMGELTKGADTGMRHYIPLTQDPIFEPLHNHSDWSKMVDKAEINTYPCLSNEAARAFDFWLGDWDVYVNNAKVGENLISRANGGCAIHESYTTYPRDYTGQSINYYDPLEKRWHQHWVGSSGDVTNYLESDKGDGMLQFTGESLTGSGTTVLYRMTFTKQDNGDVRQFIESSSDKGTSWTPAFDGMYKRKSAN